jgi:hypothetical protein
MRNAERQGTRDIQQKRWYNEPAFCRVHWRAGCGKSLEAGSEGGSWKPAPRSIVPVARRHDDRQGAGCLPWFDYSR